MKVLRIIGEIGSDIPRGPARMGYYLTEGLSSKGIESIVYTYHSTSEFPSRRVIIRLFRGRRLMGHYRLSTKLVERAMEEDADIVHVHGYRNFEADVGAIYSITKNVPLVLTAHGTIVSPLLQRWALGSRFQDLLYDACTCRFALRAASRIVATSNRELGELETFGIDRRKVTLIPNAAYVPFRGDYHKVGGPSLRVLIVSRLTLKNGLELAIESFAKAAETNPQLVLSIVGGEEPSRYTSADVSYKRRLTGLSKSLGIQNRISFDGRLSGESLWRKYEESDIFLWTSYYDNFGHSLVEAAHFGLPIVSTDVGVARELIGKDQGGFVVGWDRDSVSTALSTLATDSELRLSKGSYCRLSSRQFTVERMVDSYTRLYRSLLRECAA